MAEQDPLGGVLMRTLNRAAGEAPPPPADLYRTVTARYARRRLNTALAAVLVLTLVGGVIGVLTFTRDDRLSVAAPGTAEARWPGAVTTLPAVISRLPYEVDAVLDDGRIVIHRNDSEGADVGLIDPDDGNYLPFGVWIGRNGKYPRISDVRANDKWVIWRETSPGNPDSVWSIGRNEQSPRMLVEAVPRSTFSIALDGDLVIYGPSKSGMASVPAAGGAPRSFANTGGKNYRLFWPWVVLDSTRPPSSDPTLLNLRSGEKFAAVNVPSSYRDACSALWCVGVGEDGGPVSVVRVDGTDGQRLLQYRTNIAGLTPLLDRYLPLYRMAPEPDGSRVLDLVDLKTKETVELGKVPEENGPGTGDGTVDWVGVDGKRHVLDLRRIG